MCRGGRDTPALAVGGHVTFTQGDVALAGTCLAHMHVHEGDTPAASTTRPPRERDMPVHHKRNMPTARACRRAEIHIHGPVPASPRTRPWTGG